MIAALFLFGCSDSRQEVEVSIKEDGKPSRTIRITIEGEKDAIIGDPYIDEIQALSSEFDSKRSRFISERDSMSAAERKAYGEYRDQAAERIRELQKVRKAYIRDKIKELGGSGFQLEGNDFNQAVERANQYLEKSQ